MDSSSIVCMADAVIGRGASETPRLDTISYFNDSEPNWNERPYFTKVEQRRHRSGCHIEVGPQDYLGNAGQDCLFAAIPGSSTTNATRAAKLFSAYVTAQGNRVLLSGTGGDEVLGGVPTPIPELQDLIVRANFRLLARQLKLWAVNKRSPWFYLLFEALIDFLPRILVPTYPGGQPAFWLDQRFVERNRSALRGYRKRLTPFGPVPSFQSNLETLNTLRRQLSCDISSSDPPCEKRYPYLDRCLLEFLYAIPREQLVRPGQRRSLMRRAMRTMVPDEIIDRKRKAFIVRTPLAAIPDEWAKVMGAGRELSVSSLGIVNRTRLYAVLEYARQGREVPIGSWMRTLLLEQWLAGLVGRGLVGAFQGDTGKNGSGYTEMPLA
jgi:asparagine synthase (glutamine-hydrolysing)